MRANGGGLARPTGLPSDRRPVECERLAKRATVIPDGGSGTRGSFTGPRSGSEYQGTRAERIGRMPEQEAPR